ncbi:MAG: carboxymuconolactone decarboxylase family protein [Myxococcota bacterium]
MHPEPRIKRLSVDEAAAAAREVGIAENMAALNIFRVLLHHPPVAKAVHDLLVALLFRSKLDDRLRELVIMRIGWSTASDYEWTQHWRVAREQFGVSDEDLLAVRDWRGSDRFGPAEQAVLAATDEALETGTISPASWAECEAHIGGREELIELVAVIGNWRMISQLLRSLEIPLENGVASWPPDSRRP